MNELKYLALGDSYTIGEGVEEESRWPNQLALKLKSLNMGVDKVEIIATTGWTTHDLLKGIETRSPGKHNLVSLLIGVNNQHQKLPFEKFEKEFDLLLNKAVELADDKSHVFVVSIPDYGVTPYGAENPIGIGKEIDKYNAQIAKACEAKEIPLVDITGISREMGNVKDALAEDKLHPSAAQYTRWTESILPVVAELLQK
jgi:lysophospholipase L1-like esterase